METQDFIVWHIKDYCLQKPLHELRVRSPHNSYRSALLEYSGTFQKGFSIHDMMQKGSQAHTYESYALFRHQTAFCLASQNYKKAYHHRASFLGSIKNIINDSLTSCS